MLNHGLEEYFRRSDSSSSYFDFVEKQTEHELRAKDAASPMIKPKEDGLVVQVMDQKTSDQLKLKYFT